jgi:hypothetical protein
MPCGDWKQSETINRNKIMLVPYIIVAFAAGIIATYLAIVHHFVSKAE